MSKETTGLCLCGCQQPVAKEDSRSAKGCFKRLGWSRRGRLIAERPSAQPPDRLDLIHRDHVARVKQIQAKQRERVVPIGKGRKKK